MAQCIYIEACNVDQSLFRMGINWELEMNDKAPRNPFISCQGSLQTETRFIFQEDLNEDAPC
jgi:hypothetical protein